MSPTQVKEKLEKTYRDGKIEVIDLTGTEDHYQVFVESKNFAGMSRIQQHQAVMKVFDLELKSGEVHALTIKTTIPNS